MREYLLLAHFPAPAWPSLIVILIMVMTRLAKEQIRVSTEVSNQPWNQNLPSFWFLILRGPTFVGAVKAGGKSLPTWRNINVDLTLSLVLVCQGICGLY